MSPRSTIESVSNTLTRWAVFHGRSSIDASRIPAGPKRAPGRIVVAVSNGTPMMAASTSVRSSGTCGKRANVRMPV